MSSTNHPSHELPTDCRPHKLLEGITVLVVDDRPEEVRVLTALLRHEHCEVLLATDGHEAVRIALEHQPSLILLDVILPPSDGFEVCKALRKAPATRDIPVLFISGRIDSDYRLRGFDAGGRDYIIKPFIEAEVLARVSLHVDLARRLPRTADDFHQATVAPAWFTLATKILLGDLATTPKLQALAHTVGTNPRKLNETFRARLGLTVFGFLAESRMKEAYRLLKETDLPIQLIGMRVGYPLAANFATAFKERFGVSPRQMRRKPE